VIESYVDLTYRGLSLGRRIRMTQIRPSTGYIELPAPMPVGTPIAITTDDGATFDAIVTWIHEQVAGSDRSPGMIVTPELTEAEAAAWWTARVSLPDEHPAGQRTGGRSRPVTVRPRSHTDPMPPPASAGAVAGELPMIVADLEARVAAAAGVDPIRPAGGNAPTIVTPAYEAEPAGTDGSAEPTLQRTGEHDVIDDGKPTMIMESIDPATLGIDAGASGVLPRGDTADDADPAEAEDGDEIVDDSEDDSGVGARDGAGPVTIPNGTPLPPGRGQRKRKLRR
jgi:hypothetical protein